MPLLSNPPHAAPVEGKVFTSLDGQWYSSRVHVNQVVQKNHDLSSRLVAAADATVFQLSHNYLYTTLSVDPVVFVEKVFTPLAWFTWTFF